MKERKIGEVFEYHGEWYQCVEHKGCHSCAFTNSHGTRCGFNGDPHCAYRSDGKPAIFKKLEKVGKPFSDEHFGLVQKYELKSYGYSTKDKRVCFVNSYEVFIKIQQTKEDMEERKLNLKPFDLEAAKADKPVCTRDGRKVRIVCFDRINAKPILALVPSTDGKGEDVFDYFVSGKRIANALESDLDLMMLPEKKEGWVNVYKGIDGVTFSKYPYTSKDEAIKESDILFGRIDTIKVSWEE